MGRKDLIHFATQLQIMIETGVTLTERWKASAAQAEKPASSPSSERPVPAVPQGGAFSSACQRHPRSFPRLFIALIAASEQSGLMSRLLGRAVSYLRDE